MSRNKRTVHRELATMQKPRPAARQSTTKPQSQTKDALHVPKTIQNMSQSELPEAELLASLSQVRTGDDEQIVFQVMPEAEHANGNNDEGAGEQQSAEPQLTEEEINEQLQKLLDSQLVDPPPEDDSQKSKTCVDDGQKPTKRFSADEMQSFLNNQLKKQNQANQEKELHQQTPQQLQGRQIIIVTETEDGEKIFLLQNTNEDGDEITPEAIVEYSQQTEIDEQEEMQIQMQARQRQAAFVSQLEILRKKHQETLHPDVTTPAVPHMQPIKLLPIPKAQGTLVVEPVTEEDLLDAAPPAADTPKNFSSRKRSSRGNGQRPRVTNLKLVARPEAQTPAPKWHEPMLKNLQSAQMYIRRRECKIDEVAKFFPTPSSAFERRCVDLRHDFTKIDKMIDRFKSAMTKELDEANAKFRAFLTDYHLGSVIDELDAEAANEQADIGEPHPPKRARTNANVQERAITIPVVEAVDENDQPIYITVQQDDSHDDNGIIRELQAYTNVNIKSESAAVSQTTEPEVIANGQVAENGEDEMDTAPLPPPAKATPTKQKQSKQQPAPAPQPKVETEKRSGRPARAAAARSPKWSTVISSRRGKGEKGGEETEANDATSKRNQPRGRATRKSPAKS